MKASLLCSSYLQILIFTAAIFRKTELLGLGRNPSWQRNWESKGKESFNLHWLHKLIDFATHYRQASENQFDGSLGIYPLGEL
jgi:hypothetical protein